MRQQYARPGPSSQQERDREAFEETARRYARMHERSTNWGSSSRLREEAARSAQETGQEAVSIGKKIGQIVSVCFL